MKSVNKKDQNVLDLRQILADRQNQAKHQTRLKDWWARRERAPRALPVWHKPRVDRDWPRVGREAAKFTIGLGLVGIFVFGVTTYAQISRAADDIQRQARQGLTELQRGGEALAKINGEAAQNEFTASGVTFEQAAVALNESAGAYRSVPYFGAQIKAAENLIRAGQAIAAAGVIAAGRVTASPPPTDGFDIDTDGIIEGSLGFVTSLLTDQNDLRRIIEHLDTARTALSRIPDQIVPADYRTVFRTWKLANESLLGDGNHFIDLAD